MPPQTPQSRQNETPFPSEGSLETAPNQVERLMDEALRAYGQPDQAVESVRSGALSLGMAAASQHNPESAADYAVSYDELPEHTTLQRGHNIISLRFDALGKTVNPQQRPDDFMSRSAEREAVVKPAVKQVSSTNLAPGYADYVETPRSSSQDDYKLAS